MGFWSKLALGIGIVAAIGGAAVAVFTTGGLAIGGMIVAWGGAVDAMASGLAWASGY